MIRISGNGDFISLQLGLRLCGGLPLIPPISRGTARSSERVMHIQRERGKSVFGENRKQLMWSGGKRLDSLRDLAGLGYVREAHVGHNLKGIKMPNDSKSVESCLPVEKKSSKLDVLGKCFKVVGMLNLVFKLVNKLWDFCSSFFL